MFVIGAHSWGSFHLKYCNAILYWLMTYVAWLTNVKETQKKKEMLKKNYIKSYFKTFKGLYSVANDFLFLSWFLDLLFPELIGQVILLERRGEEGRKLGGSGEERREEDGEEGRDPYWEHNPILRASCLGDPGSNCQLAWFRELQTGIALPLLANTCRPL